MRNPFPWSWEITTGVYLATICKTEQGFFSIPFCSRSERKYRAEKPDAPNRMAEVYGITCPTETINAQCPLSDIADPHKNNKIPLFPHPIREMQSIAITVFPPGLDRHDPFIVKSMTIGDTDYSDELSIADPETLGTLLRKIDDDPKILATWNLYLEKDQPSTIASTVEKWEEIKDWLRDNQRSKHW